MALGTWRNCIIDCKFRYGDSAMLHQLSEPLGQLKIRFSSREVYVFLQKLVRTRYLDWDTHLKKQLLLFKCEGVIWVACTLWSFIFNGHNASIVWLSLNITLPSNLWITTRSCHEQFIFQLWFPEETQAEAFPFKMFKCALYQKKKKCICEVLTNNCGKIKQRKALLYPETLKNYQKLKSARYFK